MKKITAALLSAVLLLACARPQTTEPPAETREPAPAQETEAPETPVIASKTLPELVQGTWKLLPKGDTALFIAYEYKNLLTTNTEETINYLSKEIQSGLLSINEARSKLGMTDIGDAGDYYFLPAQLMPVTDETINAYMAKSKAIMDESEHNPAGDDKI